MLELNLLKKKPTTEDCITTSLCYKSYRVCLAFIFTVPFLKRKDVW